MPAVIRVSLKTLPTGVPVGPVTVGESRNDLRKGYEVTCTSVHTETSYSWTLAFTPETSGPPAASGDDYLRMDSTANLTSTTTAQTKFQVDNEGSYLIRLVTDVGLGTEDVQFLRLRVKTSFAELFLIAAGERRDESGTIPTDVSAQGWANEQNSNIQRLMLLVRRASVSGRVLYVDANRGRDNTDPAVQPNDPENIIRMPGPEIGRLDESGMRIACEGFADFSSINSAIAYAEDCELRGEAALGELNPYFIKIAAGFYQEDLRLVPHVHLMADEDSFVIFGEPEGLMPTVGIFGTGNPGAEHTFTSTLDGDICVLKGIIFMNQNPATEPMFRQTGGYLVFDHCTAIQAAGTGPIVLSETNVVPPSPVGPALIIFDSNFYMQLGDPDLYALVMPGLGGIYARDSLIAGDSTILYNTDFQNAPYGGEIRFENCWVRSMTEDGRILRGYPGTFVAEDTLFDNEEVTVNPTLAFEPVDGTGVVSLVPVVGYPVELFLSNSEVSGDVLLNTNGTSNTVEYHPSSTRILGELLLPTPVKPIDDFSPRTNAYSVNYVSDYTNPEDPPGPVIPVLKQLGVNKVQDAIDLLVQYALPLSGAPYFSLDSGYDGLASHNPVVYGAGDGREITADEGAVQIVGALTPVASWLLDQKLTGGLQVEGNVDIGPIVADIAPKGALDDLGSEINMRPGTYAGFSSISLGRSVGADGFTISGHRGLPGGIIYGGNPNAANDATYGHVPFNLHLRTRNNYNSLTDELGRVVLGGGDAYPDFGSVGAGGTKGGGVYVQGGMCFQQSAPAADEAGYIFLAPGSATQNPSLGPWVPAKVRVCLLNDTADFASLEAAGVFTGNVTGILYLSGLNGMEQFAIDAADDLDAVVNIINQTSYQFVAENDGPGTLKISGTTPGPNGDVLFVASDPVGLNIALGELRTGAAPPAIFTPGSYSKYVDIACTDTDELTVYGDIHATGDITAGGTCCGGGGGGPTLDYQIIDYGIFPGPLQVNASARLVGVRNPGAQIPPARVLVLPTLLPAGRELTIKDESFSMGVNSLPVIGFGGATIDGAPLYTMNVNGMALRLYSDGSNWLIC